MVRRPEEDARRGVGDRQQYAAGLVADRGPGRHVAGLQLVAVHQRHDAHDACRPVGCGGRRRHLWCRLVHHDECLVVGGGAVRVPPCLLDAVSRERSRPRRGVGEGVPSRFRDLAERAAHGHKAGAGGGAHQERAFKPSGERRARGPRKARGAAAERAAQAGRVGALGSDVFRQPGSPSGRERGVTRRA